MVNKPVVYGGISVTALTLIIGAAYLIMMNSGETGFIVSPDNTSIYVNESGKLILGGYEKFGLVGYEPYSSKITKSTTTNSIILKNTKLYNISGKKVTLSITYSYDKNTKEKEMFPINEIFLVSSKGVTLFYNVSIFSPKVKVTLPSGETISNSGYYEFPVTKNNQVFNIRLFDPFNVSNTTYNYRMKINSSLISDNSLFYVNGTNGVLLNGTVVKIIARQSTGILSLYYNNASSYAIIENETYVQPVYADENFLMQYIPDNTSSTYIIDNATQLHNGTASGGPTMSSDSTSKYINFNGAGSVSIATPNNFIVGTNPWTISWWRYRATDSNQPAFETGDGTTTFEILFYDYAGPNGPYLYIPNGAKNNWDVQLKMQPAGTSITSQWNYYVLTRVNNTIISYIDGVNYANASYSNSIPTYSGMVLGRGQNTQYYNGRIAQFIIMNRSVTPDEVKLRNSTGRNATFIATTGYGNVYDYPTVTTYFVFINQTPSNITETNLFGTNLTLVWNITVPNLNASSVFVNYTTNNSQSCIVYTNGTCSRSGYTTSGVIASNSSSIFTFNLFETNIYGRTENIPQSTFENTIHSFVSLTGANQALLTEFYNITNASMQILEIYLNSSNTIGSCQIYICNKSYTPDTGLDFTSVGVCYNFANQNGGSFNHSYLNSSHNLFPWTLNTTSSNSGPIGITQDKIYFIIQGPTLGTCNIGTISSLSRTGATRSTTTTGVSWTNETYSIDMHDHYWESNYKFQYTVCGSNTTQQFCSDNTTQNIIPDKLPPEVPSIIFPNSTNNTFAINSSINITWIASIPYGSASISFYNVSLLNSDGTFNKTINTSTTQTFFYWNTSGTSQGNYYVFVKAVDSNNMTSNDTSVSFSIGSSIINIISVNTIAQYPNHPNTTNFASKDSANLTCIASVNGSNNISYNWYLKNRSINFNMNITSLYCSAADCNGNSTNLAFFPNSTLPLEICLVYSSDNSVISCSNYTTQLITNGSQFNISNILINSNNMNIQYKLRFSWNKIRYMNGTLSGYNDSGQSTSFSANTTCSANNTATQNQLSGYDSINCGGTGGIYGSGYNQTFIFYNQNGCSLTGTNYKRYITSEKYYNCRVPENYNIISGSPIFNNQLTSTGIFNMQSTSCMFVNFTSLSSTECINSTADAACPPSHLKTYGSLCGNILNSFYTGCTDGNSGCPSTYNYAQSSGYAYSLSFNYSSPSVLISDKIQSNISINYTIGTTFVNISSSQILYNSSYKENDTLSCVVTAFNVTNVSNSRNITIMQLTDISISNPFSSLELGTISNMTFQFNPGTTICIDTNSSEYLNNITCGNISMIYIFNISNFKKLTNNNSQSNFILTYNSSPQNNTFYISSHQFDTALNLSFKFSGNITSDPNNMINRFFVGNTLVSTLTYNKITYFSDNSIEKTSSLKNNISLLGYVKIPENITSFYISAIGMNQTFNIPIADDNNGCGACNDGNFNSYIEQFYGNSFGYYLRYYNINSTMMNVTIKYGTHSVEYGSHSTTRRDTYTDYTTSFTIPFDCRNGENVTLYINHTGDETDPVYDNILTYCYNFSSSKYDVLLNNYPVNSGCYDQNYNDCANPMIYDINATIDSVPIGGYLKFGDFKNQIDYNLTVIYNKINTTSNLATLLNSYVNSSCIFDSDNLCSIPIYGYSNTAGLIKINNTNVSFLNSMNTITVNASIIQDYLDSCNGACNIPVSIESQINGYFNISNLEYDYYGGNYTINVIAHTPDYSVVSYSNLTYYYSGWDYTMPYGVDYIEFIPKVPTSKNVTPYGQTNLIPIMNISNQAYSGKPFIMSMYLNESNSCVNLSISDSGSPYYCRQNESNVSTDNCYSKYYGNYNFAGYSDSTQYPYFTDNNPLTYYTYPGLFFESNITYYLPYFASIYGNKAGAYIFDTANVPVCNAGNWGSCPETNITIPSDCVYMKDSVNRTISISYKDKFSSNINISCLNSSSSQYINIYSINKTNPNIKITEERMYWNIQKKQVTSGNWTDFLYSGTYLSYTNMFMFADYSCNSTTWQLWNPNWYFKACCVDCACDASVN